MQDFERVLLEKLESAFEEDETEVLMFVPDSDDISYAVKVIHKPTGSEFVGCEFDSQIKNKAAALADLLRHLRKT